MKVKLEQYKVVENMAFENREKFEMLQSKMFLLKHGEIVLKELYQDLAEKHLRTVQTVKDLQNKNEAIHQIADNLQKRNHELTLLVERLESENNYLKEHIRQANKGVNYAR